LFEQFLTWKRELNESLGFEQGRDPVDTWTFLHIGAGFGMGYAKIRFPYATGITIGWEIFENVFVYPIAEQILYKESFGKEKLPNIIVDIIATLGGWGAGYILSPYPPIPKKK